MLESEINQIQFLVENNLERISASSKIIHVAYYGGSDMLSCPNLASIMAMRTSSTIRVSNVSQGKLLLSNLIIIII